ncbi:MAG: S26 family signal peptidase, partial [Selenomonadaceae bacterium]|nr:S26 family signal peptidase [Selenomonadaceae bacterium]
MNLHSNRIMKCFVACFLAMAALLTMARLSCGTLFYVNRTDSAPHGIYIPTIDQTLHAGDFVIVELPVDVPALHVKKGFLLLKQVRGFAGDG